MIAASSQNQWARFTEEEEAHIIRQRCKYRRNLAMAGLIRVTPEQLESTSGQLNQGAGTIDALLRQLSGEVSALGADWAGMGQQRFLAAFQQWQTAQVNLHQALETISQLTAQAAVSYQTNDQQVASTFGAV
jgi:WXG100 family type VII secretion target